jgi:branched-chain amino acid transport system substrate-binding protein
MKRLFFVFTLIALVVAFSVPALAQECMDEIGCVVVGPDDPIVVGAMLTTSGATSFLGEDSEGGIELAILARDGMLLDREIEVVVEDSLCSAEGGQTAAQRVAADETVLGVIGTNCSSAAAAALPIISEAGLVLISPSNTAPTLTNSDTDSGGIWEPGYYRTAHNDLFQGAVAAQFAMEQLGATTLATIHDGSPYADGLQLVMADTFTEMGGEVVFQGAVNVGDTDMTAILTDIASSAPDVLYFPVFEPEGDFITAQSSEIAGLENTVLMGADGLLAASFPANAGPNSVGMYLSGPYVQGASYDAFLAKWDEKYGGAPPSGFHAFAYDGTNIVLDAVEAVAVVQEDGTMYVGRQAMRDYIDNLASYTGLTGAIDCTTKDFGEVGTSHGDCATGGALGIFELTQA